MTTAQMALRVLLHALLSGFRMLEALCAPGRSRCLSSSCCRAGLESAQRMSGFGHTTTHVLDDRSAPCQFIQWVLAMSKHRATLKCEDDLSRTSLDSRHRRH
eukprot:5252560-Pleurochrysis_carterae.AAC.1